MIELKNVSVIFDHQVIIKNLNLTISKGSSLVIVGPSGLGKTVLLKVLAGLINPTSGHLLIEGADFHQSLESEKIKIIKRMGMLFQKNALFDSLTCGENIAFPLREVTSLSEEEIEEKVQFYLNAVGIPHAKNLFPDEISGGMQKRLGIARALALDPEIIFYDDPTAGLDPITSKKIIELIKELKLKNRSTIVTITNDMNRAYQLADEILVVLDKEVVNTGSPIETKKNADPRVQQFISGSLEGPLLNLE